MGFYEQFSTERNLLGEMAESRVQAEKVKHDVRKLFVAGKKKSFYIGIC